MTTKQSELAYDLPQWHSRPSPLRDRTLSQLSISPYGTFHVNSALPIHDYKTNQRRACPQPDRSHCSDHGHKDWVLSVEAEQRTII